MSSHNNISRWSNADDRLVSAIIGNLPRNPDGSMEHDHISDHVIINLANHMGRSEAAIRSRVVLRSPKITPTKPTLPSTATTG